MELEESSKTDSANLEAWNSATLLLTMQNYNSYCLIPIHYHRLSNFTTHWKISQSLIFVVWDKYEKKKNTKIMHVKNWALYGSFFKYIEISL